MYQGVCVGIRQVYRKGLARMETLEASLKPCSSHRQELVSSDESPAPSQGYWITTFTVTRSPWSAGTFRFLTFYTQYNQKTTLKYRFQFYNCYHLPGPSHEWKRSLNTPKEEKGYYSPWGKDLILISLYKPTGACHPEASPDYTTTLCFHFCF